MQSLNSLYFPETVLPRHLRNTLLLLPDTLTLLRPVEGDNSADNDLFMEKGICQAHTPSPLEKEKDRFLSLIHEIQEQKANNAEQFSNLTLAHLSEELKKDEHNHRAILANLTDGRITEAIDNEDEQYEADLWQARLVLALAEILDKEEAELAENFSDIDSTELDLFRELRGEIDAETGNDSDDPFAQLARIRAKLNQHRPGTIKKRLQAWKTLYAAGTLPEEYWLWIAGIEEAGDLLISEYEDKIGGVSVPLLRLNIPAQMLMRDKDALAAIKKFQEKAENVRQEIIQKLTAIAKQGHLDLVDPVVLLPDAGVLARDWNDLIEYYFPEERFGCKKLDLQFLANISLDQMIRNDTATRSSGLCHTIVALCRE